jgi:hypothetical protein
VLLWSGVAVVLARGVGAILAGPHGSTVGPPVWRERAAVFPDAEARAFAVSFTQAYLTVSPRRERRRERALSSFFAPGVGEQAAVRVPPHGPAVAVAQAAVARETMLGEGRALVTVAASLSDGRAVYLSVPLARDEHGGLAVYDLPSFGAPPPAGEVAAHEPAPLTGAEADAVRDVTGRFLEAYVAGSGSQSLAYYLVPGARVARMHDGLRLIGIDEIARDRETPAGEIALAVQVRVRDGVTRAVYPQRYRLMLVKRDRWCVAAVIGGPGA